MNTPKKGSSQDKVWKFLKDKKWHCRSHLPKHIDSSQYAGGGGIQGLENGTLTRKGLVIKSKRANCSTCGKVTHWDRWTGKYQKSTAAVGIPKPLQKQILNYYKYVDVIEQRKRPANKLVIEHRFPKNRWGKAENKHPKKMSEVEISQKFQLMKKDSSGNHNLLKSRACETCLKTGKRGTPLGFKFFYEGNEFWPKNIPRKGAKAEKGCVGCGWYDFAKWREELNLKLSAPKAAS